MKTSARETTSDRRLPSAHQHTIASPRQNQPMDNLFLTFAITATDPSHSCANVVLFLSPQSCHTRSVPSHPELLEEIFLLSPRVLVLWSQTQSRSSFLFFSIAYRAISLYRLFPLDPGNNLSFFFFPLYRADICLFDCLPFRMLNTPSTVRATRSFFFFCVCTCGCLAIQIQFRRIDR